MVYELEKNLYSQIIIFLGSISKIPRGIYLGDTARARSMSRIVSNRMLKYLRAAVAYTRVFRSTPD